MRPGRRRHEVAVRLARIGFDHVVGLPARRPRPSSLAHPERSRAGQPADPAPARRPRSPSRRRPVRLDVRNGGERDAGTIPGSIHIPLAELRRRIDEIPTDRPVVVYCAGGWRSSVAASLLRRAGIDDVSDLLGGFAAWTAMHEPVTA